MSFKDKLKASFSNIDMDKISKGLGAGAAKATIFAEKVAKVAEPHVSKALESGKEFVQKAEQAFEESLQQARAKPSEASSSEQKPAEKPTEPVQANVQEEATPKEPEAVVQESASVNNVNKSDSEAEDKKKIVKPRVKKVLASKPESVSSTDSGVKKVVSKAKKIASKDPTPSTSGKMLVKKVPKKVVVSKNLKSKVEPFPEG